MDFFEHVNENLSALNRNERKLLDYIIRNIREVAGKSIREVAQDNYVSTTTILRLTKKLGFNGYRDFSDSLKIALYTRKETKVPRAIQRDGYSEEYLKNIIESIRVLSPKAVSKFEDALKKKGVIYCYGEGFDQVVAHYAYGLFTSIGCLSYFPKDDFEIQSMVEHVNDDDILFLVSLTGENNEMIQVVEQSRLKSNPTIVAITWSGNNTLQNLCDIDFYVFTEQVTFKGYDLTSRVSMVALIEILVHHIIANKS